MKELVFPRFMVPRAQRHADKEGFVDVTSEGVRYRGTFGSHLDRVSRLCHALRTELEVSPGDRFAVLAMNGHEFIELYHAAMFGAGVINPLNIRFTSAELAYVLTDSGSKVVFTDPVFATLVEQARHEHGADLRSVVVFGGTPPAGSQALDYEQMLSAAEPMLPSEPEEDDPVVLMYTGGTTGLPKGALLEQRAEVLNVYHVGLEIGLREDRRFLFMSPMFHAAVVAGVVGIPASGATSVSVPLFDPGLVLRVVEQEQVDTTMMVPIMFSMLENHPDFHPDRLRSLRQLVYGAAPATRSVLERWIAMLPDTDFYQGYGMTEAASVLTMLGPADHRAGKLDSAGAPVFGVELAVTDSMGNYLARGETGEICAKGGNLMRQYWAKPEETAEAFRDGWYRTGDVGFLDGDGYLHLTDRAKDMIVTGGENVYSTEVENVLSTHPAVREAAVIGIPSDLWGEAVHAVVVLNEGMLATAEDLIDHARKVLAGFKVPKSVEFHNGPLPLSGAFKPLKRELRKKYWEGRDRGVA
ncbi:MAG TPA: AMP-binding protein [Acidimicrobiales bacterium]|nr:AMP-binding protein [Acidimicrobiales bacterium]